jgi:hypothetical protein
MDAGEFTALLAAAGAVLVTEAIARADADVTTLTAAAKLSAPSAASLESSLPGPVLDQTWVLDSISFFDLLPTGPYRVSAMAAQRKGKGGGTGAPAALPKG